MNPNTLLNNGTRRLLLSGQFGCVLFIVLFLVQGACRVNYYPLKFPVSSLSIGEYGWVQRLNFITSGILILLSAMGISNTAFLAKKTRWLSRVIAIAAIGLIGAGIFSSDPVYGYPIDQPFRIAQFTITGHLHDLFSIFFFVGMVVACFKVRNGYRAIGQRYLATICGIAGWGMLAGLFLTGMGFKQVAYLALIPGLLQRLTIIGGLSWLCFLIHILLKPPSGASGVNNP